MSEAPGELIDFTAFSSFVGEGTWDSLPAAAGNWPDR